MVLDRDELLLKLNAGRYVYKLYEHPPVFTAEEASRYCAVDVPISL